VCVCAHDSAVCGTPSPFASRRRSGHVVHYSAVCGTPSPFASCRRSGQVVHPRIRRWRFTVFTSTLSGFVYYFLYIYIYILTKYVLIYYIVPTWFISCLLIFIEIYLCYYYYYVNTRFSLIQSPDTLVIGANCLVKSGEHYLLSCRLLGVNFRRYFLFYDTILRRRRII
jgi:hypothetical protein